MKSVSVWTFAAVVVVGLGSASAAKLNNLTPQIRMNSESKAFTGRSVRPTPIVSKLLSPAVSSVLSAAKCEMTRSARCRKGSANALPRGCSRSVKYGQCWVFSGVLNAPKSGSKLVPTSCSRAAKYGQCWVFGGLTAKGEARIQRSSCTATGLRYAQCWVFSNVRGQTYKRPTRRSPKRRRRRQL